MCPHCQTNNPPRIDNHWLFYCPKCGRGEIRPLPVEMPLERALKFAERSPIVERKKEQPRLSTCPDCGKEFWTKAHRKAPRCPACGKEWKRRYLRERWQGIKKARLAVRSDDAAAGVVLKQKFNANERRTGKVYGAGSCRIPAPI